MASGLQGPARLCLRIMLWLAAAVIVAVLAFLINMQINVARYGGWEMAEGIGLMLGLMLIVYYTIVLVLGRIMLRRGGARWGWFFVTLMVLLVLLAPFALWKLAVG